MLHIRLTKFVFQMEAYIINMSFTFVTNTSTTTYGKTPTR